MNQDIGLSFDALFAHATMGILIADERGTMVMVNPFLLQQFGYNENELIGQRVEKLIPSRFGDRHPGHVDRFAQHPNNRPMGQGMDLFAARRDGSEFAVEVSLGSYETDAGRFVIAFVSDISKRKEAEEALHRLNDELEHKVEERTQMLTGTVKQLARLVAETEVKDQELNRANDFLNDIWEHAEAMIYVTDAEGKIKMFNPSAEKHLGYTAAELVGISTPSIFHDPEDIKAKSIGISMMLNAVIPDDFSALAAKANLREPNEFETRFIRKNGSSFPVSETLTAMSTTSGLITGYLGIAMDISERKQDEDELRVALEKEKELNELKSRFVSMASHEFRTPLSTVLSSAYLISKYTEKEDHPKREKHIQRIVSSVNMLTDILNDFLSVGKIEEGKIQVRYSQFDLRVLLQQVMAEMGNLLKKGQRFLYSHKGSSEVVLDASLVKHIVLNLLSNAIKFSPEDAAIEFTSECENGEVRLMVQDKGIGIDDADQEHLFERFYRGANATNIQGTGLGLHIVSKYVELMNGGIKCNSRLGEGTRFNIHLRPAGMVTNNGI
jgi:PAS domain S-box-containing protein